VRKERIAADNYYDAWLPELSPSDALVKVGQAATSDADWRRFEKRYRAEMKRPEATRLLELLARLSQTTDLSIGCYCENEKRCHRSILRELLAEHGAAMARE
jgi:uncharacterized protein YeaO (DUF488 family)